MRTKKLRTRDLDPCSWGCAVKSPRNALGIPKVQQAPRRFRALDFRALDMRIVQIGGRDDARLQKLSGDR